MLERMAQLITDGGELVLRLSALEKLGALHGDIHVPLAAVERVARLERGFSALRGVRAPGTGFPRVIALGTWRSTGGRDFAAIHRGRPALVVDLRDQPFRRLVVSVDDPDATAARLLAAREGRGDVAPSGA